MMEFINETLLVSLDHAHEGLLPPYDVIVNDVITPDSTFNNTTTHNVTSHGMTGNNKDFLAIIGISLMFCIIGIVGIVGNTLIICFILMDRKMRRSVTNLFIMNLAISDLLIMLFGVPETVQFILNRGWLLGDIMCKIERYVLVVSLYSSVITAVAVCVERYDINIKNYMG